MYIPKEFEITDRQVIREFLEENPFGLLTAGGPEGRVEAAHLPFLFHADGDSFDLFTHLSVHNPLALLRDGTEALIVVLGEHGYVSSSWYGHPNVPTWNYMSVHLRGQVYFQSSEDLWNQLKTLTRHHENSVNGHIDPEKLPGELMEAYMKEIRGMQIKISSAEAAFKLSQNRNRRDFDWITEELQHSRPALAAYMRKHYPG